MKKILRSAVLLMFFVVEFIPIYAQSGETYSSRIAAERDIVVRTIQSITTDKEVSLPVIKNFETQLDKIEEMISKRKKLGTVDKEKAQRSLGFFLQEAGSYLERKKLHLYELGDALTAFKNVLDAILQHQPVLPVLRTTGKVSTELLAASFTQFKEQQIIEDAATFKRVSSTPEFIFQFLEAQPKFRFADSLLLEALKNDPVNAIYYLKKNGSRLQDRSDSYIQQIVSISGEKNAIELALFAPQLKKGTMTVDQLALARSEPTKYFQLLVNTLVNSRNNMASNLIRNGIRDKAIAFYVNDINNLHNSPDAIRFASVNGLRPEDLYYIITTTGDELYTSSYLGLYKRLMSSFDTKNVDSLFELVQWENFDVFIRMAANYNVLSDFFKRLSPRKLNEVLQLFIGYLDSDPATALEKAMDIGDSFGNLSSSPEIMDLFQSEIETNLERCRSNKRLMGVRLYTILHNLLTLTRQEGGEEKIWRRLGDYETLNLNAVTDTKEHTAEVVLFYGDEDGNASFNNFLKNYNDKTRWKISRNDKWITIRSLAAHPLEIYANLPLEMANKSDIKAQDALFDYLRTNTIDPAIIVHRGHSYHLDKTLKRLNPSVKLAILGSCGGYNKSISIASINPDIQVIGSKKTGSKLINDPMLDVINETIAAGKDISWPEVWKKLDARFKKDSSLSSMFSEYFPPSHNLSLFVLKLYQSNISLIAS